MSLSLADGSWAFSNIGDRKFVLLVRHSEGDPSMTRRKKSITGHLDNVVSVKPIQVAAVALGVTF